MDAFICDALRTPIGRYGGCLSGVRPDDLAALAIKALLARNPALDPRRVEEVVLGCANQSGEDNRNVARMAALLAGLSQESAAVTLNRLCGSGMDAVGYAAGSLHCGEAKVVLAGGVESMSRAPFVIPKADQPFSRGMEIHDTTIGWRFINSEFRRRFGVESMPETAENVARRYGISREDQDAFAYASQSKVLAAQRSGAFENEIVPVEIPQARGENLVVDKDEHPRETSIARLASLKSIVGSGSSITAGNASGVNDGAAIMLLASEDGLRDVGTAPIARILGMATVGVEPSLMGIGPIPATKKLLKRLRLTIDDMDWIEINEAFAAQALAVMRGLQISDNDKRVNPNGGAIALGHPLGMSGARIIGSAAYGLKRTGGRLALCTMCVGVGQGIAVVIERV